MPSHTLSERGLHPAPSDTFLDFHLRLEVQGLYHVLPQLPPVSQTLPMQVGISEPC